MSSPNVVFVCKPGRMFYTVNKALVPEWPCIIEVSYIYPPTLSRWPWPCQQNITFNIRTLFENCGGNLD
jgi:hypothetical protein